LAGERRAVEGLPIDPPAAVEALEGPGRSDVDHLELAAGSGVVRAQEQPLAVLIDQLDLKGQVGLVVEVDGRPERVVKS
jgi:hypothetical protein